MTLKLYGKIHRSIGYVKDNEIRRDLYTTLNSLENLLKYLSDIKEEQRVIDILQSKALSELRILIIDIRKKETPSKEVYKKAFELSFSHDVCFVERCDTDNCGSDECKELHLKRAKEILEGK